MSGIFFDPSRPLVDTQIVSYAFKGSDEDSVKLLREANISSINATEFLLAQGAGDNKPEYAALPVTRYDTMAMGAPNFDNDRWGNKKWGKRAYKKTDQFVLDFGKEFPTYTVYGSRSMSTMINTSRRGLYRFCVSHLEKNKQKYLIKRFDYLCDANVHCIPLSKAIGELALSAMAAFVRDYNLKADVRNTINDLLIAATAHTRHVALITRDNVLNTFVADYFGGKIRKHGKWLQISFSESSKLRRVNPESKWYVNQSWRVRVSRGQV